MLTEFARGTEGYRAPELLAEPHGTFSDRTDIWGMGCILYELAVKNKVFRLDHDVREYWATNSNLMIQLHESVDSKCQTLVTTLIQLMLHRDSKHRPTAEKLSTLFVSLANANGPDTATLEPEHSLFANIPEPFSRNPDPESYSPSVMVGPTTVPINFMLPYERNPDFVGRDDLLIELRQKLCNKSVHNYNHRIAIYGCGGIGKTQIAIEYTYRYATFYKHVFWISAKDQSALLDGFQEIADVTKCAQPSLQPNDQAKVVLGWLREHDNWLLVLDNLDDISVAKGYLPKMSEGGHTLITTRDPFSKDIPAQGVELPLFGLQEAIDLLRLRSEIEPSKFIPEIASEIVHELGRLPLAIEQAAAFIRRALKGLQEFLFVYRKSRKAFLHRKLPSNDSYPNSLASTFLLSFNKLKETESGLRATKLLQILSFLNPDGILIDILRLGSQQPNHPLHELLSDELMFYEMVETLEQFSLVRRSKGDMITVHRLIQVVVKDDLTESEISVLRGNMVDMCNLVFPQELMIGKPFSNDIRPLCRILSVQFLSPLMDAAEIGNEKVASTLRRVGWFLEKDGKYDDSERLVEQSIIVYKQLLGEECENTLTSMSRLAVIYRCQGRLKKSESLSRQVLEVCERVLGEEQPATLQTQHSLAVTYWSMGRPGEAEVLQEKVLKARERVLGADHPETLVTKHSLSLTYWSMGKLKEAEALQSSVLEARKLILGPEHDHTLTSKNALASTYWSMGKLEEAFDLQEKVLEARERILGEEHPDTLMATQDLASTYWSMGKLGEAETTQKNVLETSQRVLGDEHPHTLRATSNLALTKQDQNDLKMAEDLGWKALRSLERILGSEHRWTLDAQSNLADTFWKQGMTEKAIILKERATALSLRVFGDEHPATSKRINQLREWKGISVLFQFLKNRFYARWRSIMHHTSCQMQISL